MREWLQSVLDRARERLRHGSDWPRYVVRVGPRAAEAWRIVYSAIEDGPPWSDDLIERVVDVLLEEQGTDISVFAMHSQDRFDSAHALGVLAGSIGVRDFDSDARTKYLNKLDQAATAGKKQAINDEFGRKVATFVVDINVFTPGTLKATPRGNQNFAPADELHYDARPDDVSATARALLEGLWKGEVRFTFLRASDYRVQAAIALSACVARFGDLSSRVPPPEWRDGEKLTSAEQLARLRTIAGDDGIQTRLHLSRPGDK